MQNLNTSEAVALILFASMVKSRPVHESKMLAVAQHACTEEGRAGCVLAKAALGPGGETTACCLTALPVGYRT